jgi:hypothetical protein
MNTSEWSARASQMFGGGEGGGEGEGQISLTCSTDLTLQLTTDQT